MENNVIFYLVPAASLLALSFAFYFFRQMIFHIGSCQCDTGWDLC